MTKPQQHPAPCVLQTHRQAAELNKRMLYEAQMNRAAADELRRKISDHLDDN